MNKYYYVTKYSQNFNNNYDYGILGGQISNYLELNNNEIMITFWFKFNNGQVNKIFPLTTWFNINQILIEYLYSSDNNFIFLSNNKSNNILIQKNKINFFIFKLKMYKNQIKLYLEIFYGNNKSYNLTNQIENNGNININNIIFIINRLNLRENLIIENLVFYNIIDEYSTEELINGVSNIFYFINFRNNYPNSKWLMNEIKNEFGPASNGRRTYNYINKTFIANFNDNTKEIELISANGYCYIHMSQNIIPYLGQFESTYSFNIFFKFDFYLNYFYNAGVSKSLKIKIIDFYNFDYIINIDTNNSKDADISSYISTYNNGNLDLFMKNIPYSKIYKNKNFIEGKLFWN